MAEIIGMVAFKTNDGKTVMMFDPETRTLRILDEEGKSPVAKFSPEELVTSRLKVGQVGSWFHSLNSDGTVSFGGANASGVLKLQARISSSVARQRFLLDADSGQCRIGGEGRGGEVMLFSALGKNAEPSQKASIYLRADHARIRAGGAGLNGDLVLFNHKAKSPDSTSAPIISLSAGDGEVTVGCTGWEGRVAVLNGQGKRVVVIDGNMGDISLDNADCAEEFDVDDPALEPGSVLVLDDEPGRLRLSDAPYDTRVAGILSGAGDYRPGIVLDRQPGREGRRPVALVGKVWCKAEAGSAPIRVGSLLTTSSLPGHAMAATDRERAFGAVLGKALAPLAAGVGVVPVLVALQ